MFLALELEIVFSERAKKNLKLSEGKGIQISEQVKVQPIVAIKEVAKVANVSHDTIAKVKVIQATATQGTRTDILSTIDKKLEKITLKMQNI